MEKFYEYVTEFYTLDVVAKRILDSLVLWVFNMYEYDGVLSEEGVDLLETVIADNIGMERQEIIDHWKN